MKNDERVKILLEQASIVQGQSDLLAGLATSPTTQITLQGQGVVAMSQALSQVVKRLHALASDIDSEDS